MIWTISIIIFISGHLHWNWSWLWESVHDDSQRTNFDLTSHRTWSDYSCVSFLLSSAILPTPQAYKRAHGGALESPAYKRQNDYSEVPELMAATGSLLIMRCEYLKILQVFQWFCSAELSVLSPESSGAAIVGKPRAISPPLTSICYPYNNIS